MEKVLNIIWPDYDFTEGENAVKCPFHDDDRSSAHVMINGSTALYHCKVCDEGKNLITLVADYFGTDNKNANKVIKQIKDSRDEFDWHKYIQSLEMKNEIKGLLTTYGVTEKVIKDLGMGTTGRGISYHIKVEDRIVDIRTYNPTTTPKVKSLPKAVTGWLYPQEAFDKKKVILVEGEKDIAVLRSKGINAATIIGGALATPNKTPKWLDGKQVYIMYDNDSAGRNGAIKVGNYILKNKAIKAEVLIADISKLVSGEKEDVTDYFYLHKGTKEGVIGILKGAKPHSITEEKEELKSALNGKSVKFSEADKNIGSLLNSVVQVGASFDSSYTIPVSATIIPTKGDSEGWVLDTESAMDDIISLVDNGSRGDGALGRSAGDEVVPSVERRAVYKAVLTSPTQDIASTGKSPTEHIAYVLDTPLDSGKNYEIEYSIFPDAKRGNKSIVIVTKAIDLSTRDDELPVTKELKNALDTFKALGKKKLIENAKAAINANFNEKLVLGIELMYHSVLNFNFLRYKDIKGTIDVMEVTDTGFGKSVSSQALLKYYEAGARVSLAGSAATPQGLIGGSKAIGNSFQTTAGIIPRNHKGAVIFEELAKNNGSIMKDLTDIRTSGVAEISRVSGKITLPANVRTIFFSNPKAGKDGTNKTIDAYPNGVEVVQDLLGAREDIGRFDLIMVLGQRESVEDDPTWTPAKVIDPELARLKLKWVWSRKADQIEFEKGLELKIYDQYTKELNKKYESDLQIFGRKTWMKLAKVSIALAAYEGSHTDDYKKILVTEDHVKSAIELFDEIYGSSTFKLDRYVREERKYTKVDAASTKVLSGIASNNYQIIDQLEQFSEISSQELALVSGLDRDDFNKIISKLVMFKFIRNVKSKIIPTEKFRKSVLEMDTTPMTPPTLEEESASSI